MRLKPKVTWLAAGAVGVGLLVLVPMAANAAPLSPKQVSLTRSEKDPTSVAVSWLPAEGASRYNVSIFDGETDQIKTVPGTATGLTIKQAEPCGRLRVNVGSRDIAGLGGTSSNIWLNSLTPGGISALKAERAADFTTLEASWTPPTWAGHGTPGGYRVQLTQNDSDGLFYNEVVQDPSVTIKGLDPTLEYAMSVAAENVFGSCITAKLQIGNSRPGAVSMFKALRDSTTPSEVQISWEEPNYGGNDKVLYYMLGYGIDEVTQFTRIDGTNATVQMDSARNWIVQVYGVNQFGKGRLVGTKVPAAGTGGEPSIKPGVVIDLDGSTLSVKMTSKIGSYQLYPRLIVRVRPTTSGGYTDEQVGQNGASAMIFDEIPTGMYTVQVSGANATGEIEYARKTINVGNAGLLAANAWQTLAGSPTIGAETVTLKSNSEIRVMSTGGTSTNMAVTTDATLTGGRGMAVWVRASADTSKRISGYVFEYDREYDKLKGKDVPALVLRLMSANSTCSQPLKVLIMPTGVQVSGVHKVLIVVDGDSLYATIDDTVIFSISSLTAARAAIGCTLPLPTGTQVGLRNAQSSGSAATFNRTSLN